MNRGFFLVFEFMILFSLYYFAFASISFDITVGHVTSTAGHSLTELELYDPNTQGKVVI